MASVTNAIEIRDYDENAWIANSKSRVKNSWIVKNRRPPSHDLAASASLPTSLRHQRRRTLITSSSAHDPPFLPGVVTSVHWDHDQDRGRRAQKRLSSNRDRPSDGTMRTRPYAHRESPRRRLSHRPFQTLVFGRPSRSRLTKLIGAIEYGDAVPSKQCPTWAAARGGIAH